MYAILYDDLRKGNTMRAISYTAARNNLSSTMKQVCDDHNPIIVTRKNEDSVIIMSMEDYESLTETAECALLGLVA